MYSPDRRWWISAPAALAMPALSAPAEGPTAVFAPRDLFSLQSAADPQVRPDGGAVAYVRVSNDLMTQCTRDITGRELVLSGFFGSIGIWPNQHPTAEMERAAAAAMARLGVPHLANRWLDELSSGEARRLLIARALIHSPETLLIDEPTTSLDLAAQREMRNRLRDLAKSGVGILLVTHHLEEIIPEIDRVVLLRGGTVLADGRKEEMLNDVRLSALFETPVTVTREGGFYRGW